MIHNDIMLCFINNMMTQLYKLYNIIQSISKINAHNQYIQAEGSL